MPVATGPAVAVLENQIYAVGGGTPTGQIADTQIYDPATNSWSTGAPLPVATGGGCAAVVSNVLYYIGGNNGTGWTRAVWVYKYDAKTKSWSWSAGNPIPTGGVNGGCAVADDIIYVFGGYNGGFLTSVESYNPRTGTWTEEAPMLSPEAGLPGVGRIGTTIVVTDGSDGDVDGNNQGYDATTNTWSWLASDPTLRQDPCAAPIGGLMYSAGGWNVVDNPALTLTESYSLSKNEWTTTGFAPMPLGTFAGGSAAYNGRLYCFGGLSTNSGSTPVNNVQIYQP